MRLEHRFVDFDQRDMDAPFDERINGPDSGVINAWRAGVVMRKASMQGIAGLDAPPAPEVESAEEGAPSVPLHVRAEAGELPVLPFRGGVARPLKIKQKIGAMHYLAMWQGLRGDDLDLDTEAEPVMTCARHGVRVMFTLDYEKLRGASAQD